MISHVFVGVQHFDRALKFYRALMQVLGYAERFCDPAKPWAAWQSHPDPRPLFIIGKPFNEQPHVAGNGQMIALSAQDHATVDLAFAAAIQAGGADEGQPGIRPHYHTNYYGAYFRDTEGNKLCVVCHTPE